MSHVYCLYQLPSKQYISTHEEYLMFILTNFHTFTTGELLKAGIYLKVLFADTVTG